MSTTGWSLPTWQMFRFQPRRRLCRGTRALAHFGPHSLLDSSLPSAPELSTASRSALQEATQWESPAGTVAWFVGGSVLGLLRGLMYARTWPATLRSSNYGHAAGPRYASYASWWNTPHRNVLRAVGPIYQSGMRGFRTG